MPTATFRFHPRLNVFLSPARRGGAFVAGFARDASVKQAVEAFGVPHTEIACVLVNGVEADFARRVAAGDRIDIHPVAEARADAGGTPAGRSPRFIADAHLGGLARLLRLAGFDTLFRNDYADAEIGALAVAEDRVVLTRDRALLMRRELRQGCYVRATRPPAQFRELVARLGLAAALRPFSRCLVCNGELAAVDAAAVADRLPPNVAQQQRRFTRCAGCDRVYWPGSHWRRMRALLGELAPSPAGA